MQKDNSFHVDQLNYWLALWRVPGIGSVTFSKLLQCYSDLKELFKQSERVLAQLGLSTVSIRYIKQPDWRGVEKDLQWAEHANHFIITQQHPAYPALLNEIANPPPLLFVTGNLQILSQPQLAIVGSRNPTITGSETALQFAQALSAAGLVITSGLALGIDAASHRGALLANGKTIAVVGTGLDVIYPAKHQALAKQIIEQGALISEFPINTPARPEHFPQRNRLISGLSLGTLVVEAGLRSGSLITAYLANEQGRQVFAMPGSIHNPLALGCHELIRQGAALVQTVDDILTELGFMANPNIVTKQPASKREELEEDYQTLLTYISYEPTSIDKIIVRSGFSARQIAAILPILELKGYIVSASSGYSRR